MNYSVRTTIFILVAMLFCGTRAADNVKSQNNSIVSNNTPPSDKPELKKGDTNQQNLKTAAPDPLWLSAMTTESKVVDIALLYSLAPSAYRVLTKQGAPMDYWWTLFLGSAAVVRKDSMIATGTALFNGCCNGSHTWGELYNKNATATVAASVMAVTGLGIMCYYAHGALRGFWQSIKPTVNVYATLGFGTSNRKR